MTYITPSGATRHALVRCVCVRETSSQRITSQSERAAGVAGCGCAWGWEGVRVCVAAL
jgi:hypothetical protein